MADVRSGNAKSPPNFHPDPYNERKNIGDGIRLGPGEAARRTRQVKRQASRRHGQQSRVRCPYAQGAQKMRSTRDSGAKSEKGTPLRAEPSGWVEIHPGRAQKQPRLQGVRSARQRRGDMRPGSDQRSKNREETKQSESPSRPDSLHCQGEFREIRTCARCRHTE